MIGSKINTQTLCDGGTRKLDACKVLACPMHVMQGRIRACLCVCVCVCVCV